MNSGSKGDYEQLDDNNHETEIIPTETLSKPAHGPSEPVVIVQKSKYWVVTAILSGLSFGTCNIFLGKASHYGVYSREVVSVGAFIFSAIYLAIQMLIKYVHR